MQITGKFNKKSCTQTNINVITRKTGSCEFIVVNNSLFEMPLSNWLL